MVTMEGWEANETYLSEKSSENTTYQEGGVNSSDLADPMIIAIMTSRRKKRANAQNFRKWRRRLLLK